MDNLLHLIEQWLRLTAGVAGVLATGAVGGWGFTLFFMPRRHALRWIVTAPLAGMALLSVIGLPISLLGVPVRKFSLPLLAGLAVFGVVATAVLWHRHPVLRQWRFAAYLRVRGLRLLVLIGIITTLATYLMTGYRATGLRDYWGTSDYAAYWGTADYLANYGAGQRNYEAQSEFRSDDVHAHLSRHARLGCMVYLATVAVTLDAAHIHRSINVTIVSAMCLLVGLLVIWLESVRCRAFWPLLVIVCHPFLYFLLFYTYLSQATGVVLTFGGILLGCETILGGRPNRPGAIASGLLIAAGFLHYPSMPPVVAVFCAAIALALVRRKPAEPTRWAAFACLLGTLLVCTGYYLSAIVRELLWLSGPTAQQGWEWNRLIGFTEITGLATVVGFPFPGPMTPLQMLVEFTAAALVIAAGWLFWRTQPRERLFVGTLAAATGLMAAATLWKVSRHTPNATHSYVKVVSMFVLPLLAACLGPVAARLGKPRPAFWSPVLLLVLAVWILAELRGVRIGRLHAPRFREPLIELVRRQTLGGAQVAIQLGLDEQMLAPIVRNVALLRRPSDGMRPFIVITDDPSAFSGAVVDRAGPYFAINPGGKGR